MSEGEKRNLVTVKVGFSRRKKKLDLESSTHESKENKEESKKDVKEVKEVKETKEVKEKAPKALKKKSKKSKGKNVELSPSEEQKLIEKEIDKLLQGDDPNDLFGISGTSANDEADDSAPDTPRSKECEIDEPSIAKLAGLDICDDKRTSQEECLKNWMERRLKDEKH